MAVAVHTLDVSTLLVLATGHFTRSNLIGVSSLFEDTTAPDGCAEEDGRATPDNG
jgi:hypothetical protein